MEQFCCIVYYNSNVLLHVLGTTSTADVQCGFTDAIPRTMGFNYIRAHCNYYNGFHDVLYESQLIKTLVEIRVRKQIAFITKYHELIRNQNYLTMVYHQY